MPNEAKFENDDLPKILAALEMARRAGSKGSVLVHFDKDGGVVSIEREFRQKVK